MFWWSPLSLGTGVFSYLPLSVEVGDGGDLSLTLACRRRCRVLDA